MKTKTEIENEFKEVVKCRTYNRDWKDGYIAALYWILDKEQQQL